MFHSRHSKQLANVVKSDHFLVLHCTTLLSSCANILLSCFLQRGLRMLLILVLQGIVILEYPTTYQAPITHPLSLAKQRPCSMWSRTSKAIFHWWFFSHAVMAELYTTTSARPKGVRTENTWLWVKGKALGTAGFGLFFLVASIVQYNDKEVKCRTSFKEAKYADKPHDPKDRRWKLSEISTKCKFKISR